MTESEFKLSSGLKLGPVCLRTKNAAEIERFYHEDFGLKVIRRDGDFTALGTGSTGQPLLILHHDEKASTPPPNAAGLYHFALLVPDRKSLADAYLSLGNKGVIFDGYADHQVSEALYLTDPQGNGIEIYNDRPRSEWRFDDDGVEMTTAPLDLDSLIKESSSGTLGQSTGIAEGSRVGHVHLKVSDLQTSIAFYRDGLGLELMRYLGNAAFLSAGCYHHHVGLNTWQSLGGPAGRANWTGLEYVTLRIPEADLIELSSRLGVGRGVSGQLSLSDPDDISLIFTAY